MPELIWPTCRRSFTRDKPVPLVENAPHWRAVSWPSDRENSSSYKEAIWPFLKAGMGDQPSRFLAAFFRARVAENLSRGPDVRFRICNTSTKGASLRTDGDFPSRLFP